MSPSQKIGRDNNARLELTRRLEERISVLQERFIISADRISKKMDVMERDIQLLADIIATQPALNDALLQATVQMHDYKTTILALNHTLKIGEPIPLELLELFNMTQIASINTLKHTNLMAVNIKDQHKSHDAHH